MKVNRKDLIAALNAVKPFCGRSQETAAIFHHVLVDSAAGMLTASNGQIHAAHTIEIKDAAADEHFCVNPRAMAGILNTLADETVEIQVASETKNIEGSRDVHSIAIGSEFKTLLVRPASEWPVMSWCQIDDELGSVAGAVLRKIYVPANPDDMRDIIQSTYISADGSLVSTDLKRLHCVTADGLTLTEALFVPKDVIAVMKRHETVTLSLTEAGDLCLSSGELCVWFDTDPNPSFPNYTDMFTEKDRLIAMDKAAMAGMLEKACQLHDGAQHLTLKIDGQMHAALDNAELGSMAQSLDFEILDEDMDMDEPVSLHINPKFFNDAIRNMDKSVHIRVPDDGAPVTLFDPESNYRACVSQIAV